MQQLPSDGLTILANGPVTVVTITPPLGRIIDVEADERLAPRLLSAADAADPPRMLIDLSAADYFSSSFLSTLFHVWRRLRTRPGARFGLCGLNDHCRKVLTTSRLDDIWELFDSREAGAHELASGSGSP
jgi:anti-anti-sigma factor